MARSRTQLITETEEFDISNAIKHLEIKRDRLNEVISNLKSLEGKDIDRVESNHKKNGIKRMKGQRKTGIKELENILNILQKNKRGLSCLDIAKILNRKYSYTWYYLKILEDRKRVYQSKEDKGSGLLWKII